MLKDIPNYSDFKKSVIAFIDLQGFTKYVDNIADESDFIKVAKTLLATKKQFEHFRNNFNQYEITCISDSIIISVPHTDKVATYVMILALQQFQYEMLLCFGILTRGYLTIGNIYHREGLIFGEGYIRAYKGEQNCGVFPRIVIDDKLIDEAKVVIKEYAKEGCKTIFDEIVQDKDCKYFINMFKGVLLKKADEDNICEEIEQILSFCNESKKKFSNDEKILSKYAWTIDHLESEYKNFQSNKLSIKSY